MRNVLAPVVGLKSNPEVIGKVKVTLGLGTKKEAEVVTGAVVGALEETLIEHVGQNGFAIKLGQLREVLDTSPARYLSKNPPHG
jgi:uncharacterized protein (DUF2267 family)